MNEGQLRIDSIGNTLTVSLPNYPLPDDTYMEGGNMVTEYEHPDGEVGHEPPVTKEQEGDKVLIKRKDNGEICGIKINNWNEHEDVSLVNYGDYDPHIVLDPPRR